MKRAPLNAEEREVLRIGLAQFNSAGLRRLIQHIDDGEPLLLTGAIVSDEDEVG